MYDELELKPRGVLEIRKAIEGLIQCKFTNKEIESIVAEVRHYSRPIKYIQFLRDELEKERLYEVELNT